MNEETLLRISDDPAAFRRELLIERTGAVVKLGDVIDPWQERDFAAMDQAWRIVAGRAEDAPGVCRRAFLVRPRGHSKSSDQATAALWAIAFSRRRISGLIAAADGEQAALVLDAGRKALALNPWLEEFLEIKSNEIRGKHNGSIAKTITSDVGSSFGHRPDFTVADELTHRGPRGEELWGSLLSAAAKNHIAILQVITNAGATVSWQYKLFEAVSIAGSGWHVASLDGPCASWIRAEDLAEQKRLLPPTSYRRLWLNQWVAGGGDALEEMDILAATDNLLAPMTEADRRYVYGAGLDLGLAKDAAAFVIVGREIRTGRYRLANVRRWQPTKARKVDLTSVEDAIIEDHKRFQFTGGLLDPWQGALLRERLTKAGVGMTEYHLHPTGWDQLARNAIEAFQNHRVKLYDHPRLLAELRAAMIHERSNGMLKFEFPRDEGGHGDTAMALLLALESARTARAPLRFCQPRGYGQASEVQRQIHRQSLAESMLGAAGFSRRKDAP